MRTPAHLLAAILMTTPASAGTVLFVDADAPPGGDGAAWATACVHLQDALHLAADPDLGISEVRVAQGTYPPDQGESVVTGNRGASFQLRPGLAVRGGYAGYGAADPDAHDPLAFPTRLSGDLAGDDGPAFAGNGENSYHVVISIDDDETAVLEGFTIVGGNADGEEGRDRGGGLLIDGGGATIRACTIVGNAAIVGGGIYDASSTAGFESVLVLGNEASIGGGVFTRDGAPSFDDCRIADNSAVSGGGAYALESEVAFTACVVETNAATFAGGGMHCTGGMPALVATLLRDNEATFDGGGIVLVACDASLTECTLAENDAESGGGLHALASDPILVACTFSTNEAAEGAGAYMTGGFPVLVDGLFEVNIAGERGGGLLGIDTTVTLQGSRFETNFAPDGAGLHAVGGHSTLADCRFTANSAGNFGGAVSIVAGTLDVVGGEFIDNEVAFSFIRDGGAINVRSSPGANLRDAVFDGNGAGFGGAIWIGDSVVVIERCCLLNGAAVRGAGVFASAADLEIVECHFTDNATEATTISGGAAVYAVGGAVTILGGTLTGNDASSAGGGAVFADGTTLVISGAEIAGNTAAGSGGGVLTSAGEATIEACTLRGNEAAGSGGAISGTGTTLTVRACTLSFNTAAGDGGAVSTQMGSTELVDCRFRGNTAAARGGGAAATDGDLSATRCVFVSNVAGSGGATYSFGGDAALLGCLLSGNRATGFVIAEQCVFNGTGGGAWSVGGSLTAVNCTITANRAECNGSAGGVAASLAQLDNCVVWGNADDGADVEGAQLDLGSSPSINRSCVQGWTGQLGGIGNIGDDPQFTDSVGPDGVPGTVDDDRRPRPGSPCNDAGANAAVPVGLAV
ncbi:MAG: hypothetical protein GY715_03690, partial [Planctomycetes bacterium]|nr:hypothetical protein [Planctomycetota bacterium]